MTDSRAPTTTRSDTASPSRQKGSRALWSVVLVTGILLLGSEIPTPIYGLYKRQFGLSEIALTLVYSAYAGGVLAGLLLLGRLSDQFGRRRTALLTTSLVVVATVLFLFCRNVSMLVCARALYGFCSGMASGTRTAWIKETHPRRDSRAAAAIAAADELGGEGLGPLLAGLLVQYAAYPLRLPYLLFLPLLAFSFFIIAHTPETVARPVKRPRELSLRPRIGVPREIWARFIPPAVTAFTAYALGGFYTALLPTVLSQSLHITNQAAAGALVLTMFGTGALSILLWRKIDSRTAMLAALWSFLPTLALQLLAEERHSLWILVLASLWSGSALGLGFRGSLEVINEISPEDRRAEVTSAYYAVGECGVALPVIGVGVLTEMASLQTAARTFSGVLVAFSIIAIAVSLHTPAADNAKTPAPQR